MFQLTKKVFKAAARQGSAIIDNATGKVVGVVGTGLAAASPLSFATDPTTIAELTGSISFVDVGVGILAVAGLLCGVYVIWKGAGMVVTAVRRL